MILENVKVPNNESPGKNLIRRKELAELTKMKDSCQLKASGTKSEIRRKFDVILATWCNSFCRNFVQ